MRTKALTGIALIVLLIVVSCQKKSEKPVETPLVIELDSSYLNEQLKQSESIGSMQLAKGLQIQLWAPDTLAPDPIAMDIDPKGRIFFTRTNRQKNSEFDIRGYRHWMTASNSFETVADRKAFLHETFAPEKSAENAWLEDLNGDGIHDWRDLAVEEEEVWRLEDADQDGIAEKATRVVHDFHSEESDVTNAILVDGDELFVGVAPDMWRMQDTNGDEVFDSKTSLATGFGIHIGFSGHGMSGAIMGPDGKLYWGIGDIGANVTDKEGNRYEYPNQGVIVRSNPDGSSFEIFAHGLRNTHEFVFDKYGNIISSDNDGDHQGESERLVHIVEGSDAGWRSNWQYGKYTDPKNNSYKVWMDEKLFKPRWEGQAAYIIPPIMNYHNGPTGMQFNPGTALGSSWVDKFFLVEFVGDPVLSHIWSFDLKPKGASFELNSEVDMVSGILPTAIKFGPDGALYVADWINGWGTKNSGRVWKLDVTEDENDLAEQRLETQKWMTTNFEDLGNGELVELLSYPDMRIRQKAQFQLAKSSFWGYRKFKEVAKESNDQLARIHAIWGIGQQAAVDLDKADILVDLLEDSDEEIIAQCLKVLGDLKYTEASDKMISLLKSENPRIQFYAAQALGRIKTESAVHPLLDMIAENADEDVYLRHAGVLALSRIGKDQPLVDLASSDNRSLKIAAVLALRRMKLPEVAIYLKDADEYIITEAARAINDDRGIKEALPELAALLENPKFSSEPLMRRVINSALRVGGEKQLDDLINYAQNESTPSVLRGETLAALSTWTSPSVMDRVDGYHLGEVTRPLEPIQNKMGSSIASFLEDNDPEVLQGALKLLASLQVSGYDNKLVQLMRSHNSPEVRSEALKALGSTGYDQLAQVMRLGMGDQNAQVRRTAVGLMGELSLSKEELPNVVNPIFSKGGIGEQQAVLEVLAKMPADKSEAVLSSLLQQANRGGINDEVMLDLIEASSNTGSSKINNQLASLKSKGYGSGAYTETLHGGSWWAGKTVFESNPTAQCVRCHSLNGSGGKVGPALDNIANILTREQILEALIEPSKRISPGYGSVTLTLTNGQEVTGLLEAENEEGLILRTSAAEPLEVAYTRIQSRRNAPSGMPAMGKMISKRELRDLIEYLGSLKEK
ncbi:PVC-type heme-binding CxxCH protein [Flagellimonas zhangzhouensis]|uniref:Putative membrane-bound dehydrogenase domain-containing protein n=1 Tax=Flagellimonas zhangzhouensis TaxID=1073328 RepID=A0A1H2S6P3_9FLAO|nr:PVC-type heme-binding CxxCH protein [Allomuricauda zhangzhouensis]SDQ71391.1 putative membrane-bound dehydrogenase domain-containing protein [Allomuricauda zhangzhouensis]SDW27342.1 putative membrane-bound dehydrogenase domain-containing protein [Allomuricauda zhangzhouensis]